MLESLLAQSDGDFTLLVSDNHSTDGTAEILDSYRSRFKQIVTIKPEKHLSGIEHGHFAYNQVVQNFSDHTHVMFIGGHDLISPETIEHLKERASATPDSALLYTDTTRLSLAGEPLESYPNSLNTAGINRPLVPFIVLFGVGHNIMSSGIWRADVFASAKPRFVCCAADHLLLCEAALSGSITYTPGGSLFLRDAPTYQPGWRYYVEKHIPDAQRKKGCVHDYTLQSILERCIGATATRILGEPVYENYFLSAIQLYFIRYGDAAQGFDDPGALPSSELYQAAQANDLGRVLRTIGA
jgi:glycosyltransferase involved in cell wall biosynthesis